MIILQPKTKSSKSSNPSVPNPNISNPIDPQPSRKYCATEGSWFYFILFCLGDAGGEGLLLGLRKEGVGSRRISRGREGVCGLAKLKN